MRSGMTLRCNWSDGRVLENIPLVSTPLNRQFTDPSRLWNIGTSHSRSVRVDKSLFDWIANTDDPQFEGIRQRLERLWTKVHEKSRAQFTSRLRSNRYTDFLSAYNELWFLDALETGGLCCALGEITASGSLPDLRISIGDTTVVAECYLRMQSEADYRNDFVQRFWFDATFRKMQDKRARLWLHNVSCGEASPSSARLAAMLNRLVQESPLVEDLGNVRIHSRHQFDDVESGWHLDFTLIIRTAPPANSVAQLLYFGMGQADWCQGTTLLEDALSRKSHQHMGGMLPTVICIGWNHFEHEPDFDEVVDVIVKKRDSLTRSGVHGIFWARSVYPWNENSSPPHLLHWDSALARSLVSAWRGPVTTVAN